VEVANADAKKEKQKESPENQKRDAEIKEKQDVGENLQEKDNFI